MSETVLAWSLVLDDLTYYELFGVSHEATPDEIRTAFHAFCDAFHPDRHVTAHAEDRSALSTIFKRGTEAYLVLADHTLRSQYDAQLATRAGKRPPRVGLSRTSRPPPSPAADPSTLEGSVRTPAARPFARRADELIRAGDFRQAKLQLVMATHMDPGNATLEAALRQVEAKLPISRRPPQA